MHLHPFPKVELPFPLPRRVPIGSTRSLTAFRLTAHVASSHWLTLLHIQYDSRPHTRPARLWPSRISTWSPFFFPPGLSSHRSPPVRVSSLLRCLLGSSSSPSLWGHRACFPNLPSRFLHRHSHPLSASLIKHTNMCLHFCKMPANGWHFEFPIIF